jgi:putative FmdB family regulatory protein
MPTYDYVCKHCGHRFEVLHGVNAPGPSHCPVCHKGPVHKAFAPPTFHFKGTGWAKKDRGAASRKAARDGAAASGADGGADKSTKTDSKETAKTDSSSGSGTASDSGSSSSAGGSASGGTGSPSAAAD